MRRSCGRQCENRASDNLPQMSLLYVVPKLIAMNLPVSNLDRLLWGIHNRLGLIRITTLYPCSFTPRSCNYFNIKKIDHRGI